MAEEEPLPVFVSVPVVATILNPARHMLRPRLYLLHYDSHLPLLPFRLATAHLKQPPHHLLKEKPEDAGIRDRGPHTGAQSPPGRIRAPRDAGPLAPVAAGKPLRQR